MKDLQDDKIYTIDTLANRLNTLWHGIRCTRKLVTELGVPKGGKIVCQIVAAYILSKEFELKGPSKTTLDFFCAKHATIYWQKVFRYFATGSHSICSSPRRRISNVMSRRVKIRHTDNKIEINKTVQPAALEWVGLVWNFKQKTEEQVNGGKDRKIK